MPLRPEKTHGAARGQSDFGRYGNLAWGLGYGMMVSCKCERSCGAVVWQELSHFLPQIDAEARHIKKQIVPSGTCCPKKQHKCREKMAEIPHMMPLYMATRPCTY